MSTTATASGNLLPESKADEQSTTDTAKSYRRQRSVGFDRLTVREYEITVGDNPSTTAGPPVTLSWEIRKSYECPVDEYETNRPTSLRRCLTELKLPASVRRDWLLERSHSAQDIQEATKSLRKSKHERNMTRVLQEFEAYEIAWQSAVRKLKRWGKKGDDCPATAWLKLNKQQHSRCQQRTTTQQQSKKESADNDAVTGTEEEGSSQPFISTKDADRTIEVQDPLDLTSSTATTVASSSSTLISTSC